MKKRLLSAFFLAVLALTLILSVSSFAKADTSILSTSPFQTVQGETFTTTLYINDEANIIDFQIQLTYDTDMLTLVSAGENDDIKGSVTIQSNTPGKISLNYTRTTQNVTAKMPVMDIAFAVDGYVGAGAYDCFGIDNSIVPTAHTLVGDSLEEVELTCSFAKLNIYAAGDLSIDGKVDISDVTYLRRHLAQISTLSEYQLRFGDAFYDGNVDISDAVYIQRKLALYDVRIGNRATITFCNADGTIYTKKSVVFGEDLEKIPTQPSINNMILLGWSTNPNKYVAADFTEISDDMTVYSAYDPDVEALSVYMQHYVDLLNSMYYTEPTLSADLPLKEDLVYDAAHTAKIYWSTTNSSTMTIAGKFSQPTYDSEVILTATIYSYANGAQESNHAISFRYAVEGVYKTPSRNVIAQYLDTVIGDEISIDLNLPKKVSNAEIDTGFPYEVRISWEIIKNTTTESLTQIERTTSTQTVDLIATITFNGKPLEDDGKVYFDSVTLSPITKNEVRYHMINQIAGHMGKSITNGESLWNDDEMYEANVVWVSNNHDIANIHNNVIEIENSAINGTTLPLTAEVTYPTDNGGETFKLEYTIGIVNENALLVPGTNIDKDFYDALRAATNTHGNLTTDALKDVQFVYLDLSGYPNIKSLCGLTYCKNLRVLNISGLKIEEGLNEISTLTYLEAFIARECGLSSLSLGKVPVLQNAIWLKMIDLSYNNFTSLDSVFAPGVRYERLQEVYLDHNQLTDISALYDQEGSDTGFTAPILLLLTLSDNGLTNDMLQCVSRFSFLTYLSLSNNEIDDITYIKDMTSLRELRLNGNHISDIRELRKLTKLKALYLGNNELENDYTGTGNEINISYLNNLRELRVLYLNDNNIEDISNLVSLTNLEAINATNNKIESLSVLANYGDTLAEVYAENNCVANFSFVRNLTKLIRLLLANNVPAIPMYENDLASCLANLTQLESLTLSGKDLRTLSFLVNMPKLIRLEVEGCKIPSYTPISYSVTQHENGDYYVLVDSFTDNVACIYGLRDTLKILNISNNGWEYYQDEMLAYLGASEEITSIEFSENTQPQSIGILYELSKLIVLYANNIHKAIDAARMTSMMSGLKYISLEGCGITDASWLSNFRGLVYVDLSNNNITNFDFAFLASRSAGSLKYLYLDTNTECTFENAYDVFEDNVLVELSLKNIQVKHIDSLPYMDDIEYLNLSNTGISDLRGTMDEGEYDPKLSVTRYKDTLQTLHISGTDVDISVLKEMTALETLYTVGVPEDYIFYEDNVHTMQQLYNNGVDIYLYDNTTKYEPIAQTEGTAILSEIDDISCDIIVAADKVISDNNPTLVLEVNDFDVTWTVSNAVNYEIVNNKLAVKDYANIDDETLTVTATITVYPDQEPVSREFTINTDILRVDTQYISIDNEGLAPEKTRGAQFNYDVTVVAAQTDRFITPVRPVYDGIKYVYAAQNADGLDLPETSIVSIGEQHRFSILDNAPLGGHIGITATVFHTIDGNNVVDKTESTTVSIASRTFVIHFVTNGGTVASTTDSTTYTSYEYSEGATLFDNLTVTRLGYLFDGWYTDEACTSSFVDTVMPSHDITVYAKWTAHSFTLNFDANGGTATYTSKTYLCDTPLGELPSARRDYNDFNGWFTSDGTQLTTSTVIKSTNSITVSAHWKLHDVSGWVRVSEVPSNAQIVNRKWTYTNTTYVDSTSTSLSGYTCSGSEWVKSGSGSTNYASFPSGFDTSHSIYTSFSNSPYSEYENATSKRVVSNYWSGYVYYHWAYNVAYANNPRRAVSSYYLASGSSGYAYIYFDAFTSTVDCPYLDNYYCNNQNLPSYNCNGYMPSTSGLGKATPRYFRFNYYTSEYIDYYMLFHYYKTENLESTTQVSPSSTISNVVEWVQYRGI